MNIFSGINLFGTANSQSSNSSKPVNETDPKQWIKSLKREIRTLERDINVINNKYISIII